MTIRKKKEERSDVEWMLHGREQRVRTKVKGRETKRCAYSSTSNTKIEIVGDETINLLAECHPEVKECYGETGHFLPLLDPDFFLYLDKLVAHQVSMRYESVKSSPLVSEFFN